MPLYEFKCKKCGKTFEELVKSVVKDESVNCPSCGSSRVEKVMSPFAPGSKQSGGSGCAPTRGGGG